MDVEVVWRVTERCGSGEDEVWLVAVRAVKRFWRGTELPASLPSFVNTIHHSDEPICHFRIAQIHWVNLGIILCISFSVAHRTLFMCSFSKMSHIYS